MDATDALPITHNLASSRFETEVEGQLAVCVYRRQGELLDMTHTGVPPALEGRGIAAALVGATLDWARAQGLRVRPSCSYVAVYMRRHPATLDLLE
ncbi:MAG: GNAT family N-acetyltransferase [Rubrivivax sp.]|nr:GNAT family N-acetyltransferase [Rubrivivax sp.]